ncbi:hypothetical protein [Bacillus thuringiensis]
MKQEGFKFKVSYIEDVLSAELTLTIKEDNRVTYTIQKSRMDSEDYGLYVRIEEYEYNLRKDLFIVSYTSESANEIVEHLKRTKEKTTIEKYIQKTLAIELIKMIHDLYHTMRNRDKPKFQVYVFRHDEKLEHDLLEATERTKIKYVHKR